ncbi:MAG TPA: hydrogenase nickel incorporation protein HypB [Nocardioidaceae bacterium]|nr:hydrogenase nickel incorporation protein HypB [Nocardioidaceae bacterium]
MCTTCGCGADEVRVTQVGPPDAAAPPAKHTHSAGHEHAHPAEHAHPHTHPGQHDHTHTIELEQRVLAKNDQLAERNRRWFTAHGITAVNLMSSPGAGKTSLLERTIKEHDRAVTVIEGDQETVFDAERIRAAGARAVQVNTGAGCHLDATMVQRALAELAPDDGGVVFIENVGNLVCPALFDLGEDKKVVIISVTEGDDKPLKYPHMFAAADLVLVNKTDLLPYVDFDMERCERDARRVNPGLAWIPLSVRTGENLAAWHGWLGGLRRATV